MGTIKKSGLASEWRLLQNQFDSYEKYSLIIKLASIGVFCAGTFSDQLSLFVICLLLILWMQDAIWKTFQSRIETRLLQLESYLLSNAEEQAYQFNSQYNNNRPGNFGLIKEYFRQAVRPTIAFPHAVLLFILGLELVLQA